MSEPLKKYTSEHVEHIDYYRYRVFIKWNIRYFDKTESSDNLVIGLLSTVETDIPTWVGVSLC